MVHLEVLTDAVANVPWLSSATSVGLLKQLPPRAQSVLF